MASWLVRSTADRTVRVHGPGTLCCVLGSYEDITLPYCDSSLPLIHVSYKSCPLRNLLSYDWQFMNVKTPMLYISSLHDQS